MDYQKSPRKVVLKGYYPEQNLLCQAIDLAEEVYLPYMAQVLGVYLQMTPS